MSDHKCFPDCQIEIYRLEKIELKYNNLCDELNLASAEGEQKDARIAELEAALVEIRQAAEDNNLTPDYIIALCMAGDSDGD